MDKASKPKEKRTREGSGIWAPLVNTLSSPINSEVESVQGLHSTLCRFPQAPASAFSLWGHMGFVPLIRGPSSPGIFHIPSGTYTLSSPSSGGSLGSERRGLMQTSHLQQQVSRSPSLCKISDCGSLYFYHLHRKKILWKWPNKALMVTNQANSDWKTCIECNRSYRDDVNKQICKIMGYISLFNYNTKIVDFCSLLLLLSLF